MVVARGSWVPVGLFGAFVGTVYGVALFLSGRPDLLADTDLVAVGLTLDLTLLVPLAYYLVLVRHSGWPVVTLLPVFVVSVLMAEWLVPAQTRGPLAWLGPVALAAELCLVGLVVHRLIRMRREYRQLAEHGAGVPEAMRRAATAVVGQTAGPVLAYELSVLYYATFGWKRPATPGGRSLSYHTRSAYVPLAIAIMIAVVVETVALHLLIQLWTAALAWVLTALSVYALIWLIGDTHAVRHRPIRFGTRTLHVRNGLRWTVDVPLDRVTSVESTFDSGDAGPGALSTVLLGEPQRRLRLEAPVEARGPYGIRKLVTVIDLQLDDPARFDALWNAYRDRVSATPD